jgi:hypothetical protein
VIVIVLVLVDNTGACGSGIVMIASTPSMVRV